MPASFSTLPTEILCIIIELAAPDSTFPVIGYDAVWVHSPINVFNHPREQTLVPTHSQVFIDGRNSVLTDIANLHQTCRRLHALCTPVIRQDLNLLVETIAHDRFALEQASKYWQYIHTIRFFLSHRCASEEIDNYNDIHEKAIMDVISLCTQATSIAIYHVDSGRVSRPCQATPDFGGQLFDTLTKKNRLSMKSLGIYCLPLLQANSHQDPLPERSVMPFFDRMISRPSALQFLEHFDIAEQLLPPSSFPTFPLPASLTFLRSWFKPQDDIWTFKQLYHWIAGSQLVRLQLINCEFRPEDIPLCVRTCSSLQYLYVNVCGYFEDAPSSHRPPGWSKQPDALCVQRKPLRFFWVDCMYLWELVALGVIPALHVTITSVLPLMEEGFYRDKELFPLLQKLSIPPEVRLMNRGDSESVRYLEAMNNLTKERDFVIEDTTWPVKYLWRS
ncbi:hypothetical protein CPB86DRAFT_810424 [Serendipita vermifera]|nr:hypothetical protein CPB86DRAFT_810424 [Serendipita vermifera]